LLNLISAIHGTGVAASTNSYESIATVTVGAGGSSSISFSSIPSTYKHLQIRAIGRQSGANTGYAAQLRVNGNSGSNYTQHRLRGNGTTATAAAYTAQTSISIGGWPAANSSASIFGTIIIDILDYTDTNKYKTIRYLQGTDQNSATDSNIFFDSGFMFANTNAITQIDIIPDGTSFVQYSQFALYGIKG